jgi:elongation factor G
VANATRDTKERLGQLFHLDGKKQQPIASALPGEIVAVTKLKETHTGDTLCDEKAPVVFPLLVEFAPVISFALGLKSRGDEEKIMSSLHRLGEEDPALKMSRDSQNDIILSVLGRHVRLSLRSSNKIGAS